MEAVDSMLNNKIKDMNRLNNSVKRQRLSDNVKIQ